MCLQIIFVKKYVITANKRVKSEIFAIFPVEVTTVWSSDLYTLLMRYEVNLTPYCIKSVYKSLNQTVDSCFCEFK